MSAGEAEINIVLTGAMGSGKSAACNFFFRQEVFNSHFSFNAVTIHTDFHVQMVGGKLTKFVDTPGLLDPSVATEQEFERLAKAILAVPNGIHALGVVIKIGNRLTVADTQMLKQLLDFIELIPYTFVIFSNAYMLGSPAHGEQQQHNFEILLNDSPAILHQLLETIGQRYIILESVLNKEQDYYDIKVDELMKIVQSILAVQKKPFTCFLNDLARQLQRSNASQKQCIDALKSDLKSAKDQLNKEQEQAKEENKKQQGRFYWQTFFIFAGTVVGAVAGGAFGTVLGPPGSAAGSTAGASLGASAVAAIVGGSGVAGGAAGYGVAKGINACRNQ